LELSGLSGSFGLLVGAFGYSFEYINIIYK
jgi:hypothetical protein